jgi:diguanylate cyclase (GGDEF)-like protein/PAS domain S-box-containing protein
VVLKGLGFEPATYVHPGAVLAAPDEDGYALAFVDVNLPDMSGLELVSTLKDRGRLDEVVFMSGHGTFDHVVRAIRLGAHDYLKKPFGVSEIKLVVSRFRERKELEERIRRAERKHAFLLQSMPLLIFTMDRDYRMVFVNQASATLLGDSPETALNTADWFLDRVHPHDRVAVREALEESFQTGRPTSLECRMLHRKGQLVHGLVRTIPPANGHADGPEEMEGIFVDITDRVFLERALVQNEKLKTLGAISAEVAHEIRNPLMTIAGFARRLERKAPENLEVGIILRESQRLEKLLNRIRDYLRPVEVQRSDCAVNAILADCMSLLFPEMEQKGVWVQMELDDGLNNVLADPEMLSQVFINLSRNAIKVMDQGGAFHIRSFESDRNVHVEFRNRVEDEQEINPELLFLPFDEGGQSIGLPLCYRLVKNMGGLLTYSAEHGHAVFTVSLAKSAGAGAAAPPQADAEQTRHCFEAQALALDRKRFDDLLERNLRSAVRQSLPLGLALVDVDHLEEFLAAQGEDAAKELFGAVARALDGSLGRSWYLLGCHGPHHLAVLMPGADRDEAGEAVRRMESALARLELPQGSGPGGADVRLSIGVALRPQDEPARPADLLETARRAAHLARERDQSVLLDLGPEADGEQSPAQAAATEQDAKAS